MTTSTFADLAKKMAFEKSGLTPTQINRVLREHRKNQWLSWILIPITMVSITVMSLVLSSIVRKQEIDYDKLSYYICSFFVSKILLIFTISRILHTHQLCKDLEEMRKLSGKTWTEFYGNNLATWSFHVLETQASNFILIEESSNPLVRKRGLEDFENVYNLCLRLGVELEPKEFYLEEAREKHTYFERLTKNIQHLWNGLFTERPSQRL